MGRLLDHRRVGIGRLSRDAGVSEDDLRSVVDGVRPDPSLLRALAPALDWHAADLFVMAGRPVPDALAPLDASAGQFLGDLVTDAVCLPADQRSRLRELAQDLPQEPRRAVYAAWKVYDPSEGGFGAMVANMVFANRNFGRTSAAAKALAAGSNGRMYVSPSTIFRIGSGRVELTADRLAGLATLLDVPAGDLAAVTGMPGGKPPEDLAAADVAALLWEVRRLSAAQARQVAERAEAMRRLIPDDAVDRRFYRHRSYGSAC
ncbi:hypothetical protein BJF79_00640 [Actinomadura sp. CNU-125]|nr:hypothetical protein BJF79_00640 [Actinomadura sp. CNU-125]